MNSPYQYFDIEELICHGKDCGCDHELHMEPSFMTKVIAMRRELGFPFVVTSAYRCPKHNAEVSHTGSKGPHTTGRAIDILVRGTRAYDLVNSAYQYGITGIGVSQKGEQRFIHLDDLTSSSRPTIWSY